MRDNLSYAMPPSVTRSPEQLIREVGRRYRRRQIEKVGGPLLMLAGLIALLLRVTR